MPQMSPLLWLNLFLMFILGYLLFSILNFFSKPPIKTGVLPIKPSLSEKTWKW
uniref:ATP synthase F0 subunit 8 n=1 Tax=Cherax quinquecarinatus TaxID=99753 RepID=W6MWN2_CHEQN|nr:ATP synthase F0 subunit 8 [Cherax quinquecarinatus]CDL72608.1 ATP synthase F0 subunit 8 [Cherax quinquecarinatus]